ncbi:MAG: argininosuccinate lyase [Gemmatimonadota bacterium]|jgi:argininosuccinate lyase
MSDRHRSEGTALWGGRFASPLDPAILEFTGSLHFDSRLVRHDVVAGLAHARMLLETGILEREEAETILHGLAGMLAEIESGSLRVEGPDEDIHTWIERTLTERIGPAAGRLHTARSRNDQVGAALRLYVRESVLATSSSLLALLETWLLQSSEHLTTWMPGYTHLQRAQPVSLAHHLLAHFWALEADGDRLRAAHGRAGVSPLGAGALAGTRHPIDPHRTAALLGFPKVCPNTLLAVADRDYVAETAFVCALLVLHLSRWAEEVVLWTSREFGFARLSDSVAQGSSLMPQKRNPEAAELIRGKSGRAIGDLTALLTMLKGLPFAYNSDLQEDKEPLFDALDTAAGCLEATRRMAAGLTFDAGRLRSALDAGFVTATDLADLLVERGTPFREAHRLAGLAVRQAEEDERELWELSPGALAAISPEIDAEIVGALRPESAGAARRSYGAPSPERVREQLEEAKAAVGRLAEWIAEQGAPPIYSAYLEHRLVAEEIASE